MITLINKLPYAIYVPGYRYREPGTKLRKRLARSSPGLIPLDEACKDHDITYDQTNNLVESNIANKFSAEKEWSRVKSIDASLREWATALAVTSMMKTTVLSLISIFVGLFALEALAGGAAVVKQTVNTASAVK